MQTGKTAIQTGTLPCSALAPAVGADVPVCMPAGAEHSKSVFSPDPSVPHGRAFSRPCLQATYGWEWPSEVSVHQTAKGGCGYRIPNTTLLPLPPHSCCHFCTETMLWVCPICKIVTPKQTGGGSTDKTHSSIYLWSTECPKWGYTSTWKHSHTDRRSVEAQTGILFEDPAEEQISTVLMNPN